jgi:hypothetical protein
VSPRTAPVARCEAENACPVACACAEGIRVPCTDMAAAHRKKLELCDALEAIADGLPQVDRLGCLRIASELVPLLRDAHFYEEDNVFPIFEQGAPTVRAASIRRLKAEHIEDQCAAQDLTDMLLAIGHGRLIENPEALGFMLRAFFEGLRRHVAFESEHIVPVVAGMADA